ncbi:hypothetical protein B0H67DRAFT_259821 [Lasiosphaeris hirsuta]|uniref:Uncharacterized protein n=1 Tax=Lasiosphaeris hirsuta TaxID=260670 RepID=A0AA40AI32_9PEZI|nr:hypothetical protein B0H67DRAFT_259821 [Lasiosphaeris hirsuta]
MPNIDAVDAVVTGDVADRSFRTSAKKRLNSSTASSQTIDTAAAWLKNCNANHNCRSFEVLPIYGVDQSLTASNWKGRLLGSWSRASSIEKDRRHLVLPGRLVDPREFSVSQPDNCYRGRRNAPQLIFLDICWQGCRVHTYSPV